MKKILLTLLALSSATLAWDGQRQGFLLGIGGGAASVAMVNGDAEDGDLESQQGYAPATSGRIGYAWDNANAILLYSNGTQSDGMIGYTGVNYQKWSSEEVNANSWFGGIGLLTQNDGYSVKSVGTKPSNTGFGINVGYGREIASHASVDMNLVVGKYDDKGYYIADESWEKSSESRAITYVAFSITMNLLGY